MRAVSLAGPRAGPTPPPAAPGTPALTWYCVQLKQCQQQMSPSTYFLAWPWSHGRLHTDSGTAGLSILNCTAAGGGRQTAVSHREEQDGEKRERGTEREKSF